MADKRMLVLPADLVNKINENRGDMSIAEFISFLIDSNLKEEEKQEKYATKDEVRAFSEDTKKLLKNFLDFFMSYGLEFGDESPKSGLAGLTDKLKELEELAEDTGKEAKIKWK